MYYVHALVAYVVSHLGDPRPHDENDSSDRGATATEYALLVAFIALVLIAGVTAFGTQLSKFFTDLGGHIGITGANS